MTTSVSDSRFFMWRAVVAMAHADKNVKPHEINFIHENTKDLPLSEDQRRILAEDMKTPVSMGAMFKEITSRKDREDFFYLAKSIAWADGDFDEQERAILQQVLALAKVKKVVSTPGLIGFFRRLAGKE